MENMGELVAPGVALLEAVVEPLTLEGRARVAMEQTNDKRLGGAFFFSISRGQQIARALFIDVAVSADASRHQNGRRRAATRCGFPSRGNNLKVTRGLVLLWGLNGHLSSTQRSILAPPEKKEGKERKTMCRKARAEWLLTLLQCLCT